MNKRYRRRPGYSMLELQVAFAAFGVILAGLCPMVVAQLKHVTKLETRLQGSRINQPGQPYDVIPTYYVKPRAEPWAQRMSGSASVSTDSSPGSSPITPSKTPATVTVLSLQASPNVEDASALVQVFQP